MISMLSSIFALQYVKYMKYVIPFVRMFNVY